MYFYQDNPLYSTDNSSSDYLKINNCGIQGRISTDMTVARPHGRRDYLLLFVESGSLTVYTIGKPLVLTAGQAWLYRPSEPQKYVFLCRKDAVGISYWVHFTGAAVEELLTSCGAEAHRPWLAKDIADTASLFGRMILCHRLQSGSLPVNSLFLQLLHTFSAPPSPRLRSTSHRCTLQIHAIMQQMECNPQADYDADALAAQCHLSRDRFVHIFKDIAGIPPHKYHLTVKLEQARRLLDYSALSISDAAAAVGFDDPLYFSRAFKKRFGLSPRAYREKKR